MDYPETPTGFLWYPGRDKSHQSIRVCSPCLTLIHLFPLLLFIFLWLGFVNENSVPVILGRART